MYAIDAQHRSAETKVRRLVAAGAGRVAAFERAAAEQALRELKRDSARTLSRVRQL
jgi:hypothetical protein